MDLKNAITDEERLIAGCKNAEPWAQKQVYELYASTMLSVCVRYVNDRETARDLLQEGFIKIFTKIEAYSGIGSFAGWIRRIFVTTSLEFIRKNDALKQSENIENYEYSIEDLDISVLEKLSAEDLLKCISELPRGFRTVFNLYTIEGYTHSEIANMLSISEATSRSQFMRARKLLQQKVQSLIY